MCSALAALLFLAACDSSVTADALSKIQGEEPVGGDDAGPTNHGDMDGGGDAMAAPGGDDGQHGDADVSSNPTPTALVHYIGRFDFAQPQAPAFEWPATSIVATFTGTSVAGIIDGADNWFEVYIDGARESTVHFTPAGGPDTSRTVMLASNLAAGTHRVQLYRRTESFFGASSFRGFMVGGGSVTPSVYPFARKIEVIGDSISCGYGDEGDGPSCGFSADTENAASTYAARTARSLDAALSVVAWSGKDMVREYGGGTTDQMPVLYDRTLPTDAASRWDFDAYVPDVIVIDLGTNDWSVGDPGQPYVDAYVAFVTRLRGLYPGAAIFCTLGPMQNSAPALAHVQQVVQLRHDAGDASVYYLEFPSESGATDLGCDYHPGSSTHAAMADVLTQAIRDANGW